MAIEAIRAELIPKIKAALSRICTRLKTLLPPRPRYRCEPVPASRICGFDAGVAADLLNLLVPSPIRR